MNLINVCRTNDNSKVEGNQYNEKYKKSIELECPVSSPTRFSAKKRNARYVNKTERTLESSFEARDVASLKTQQDAAEKVDTSKSPAASFQAVSQKFSSAFISLAQHKVVEDKKPKVAPEKKKRQKTPLSSRKNIRAERHHRVQADPEPEVRPSRLISAVRKKLELVSVAVILVLAVLSITLVNRSSQKTLTFGNNQVTYTGTTIQGKMNGQGKMTFENGDTYEGEFVDGYFQGTGTYTSKDGWTYEGQFVKGQADGQGKLTTQDKIVYEGTFKQGIYQSAN